MDCISIQIIYRQLNYSPEKLVCSHFLICTFLFLNMDLKKIVKTFIMFSLFYIPLEFQIFTVKRLYVSDLFLQCNSILELLLTGYIKFYLYASFFKTPFDYIFTTYFVSHSFPGLPSQLYKIRDVVIRLNGVPGSFRYFTKTQKP